MSVNSSVNAVASPRTQRDRLVQVQQRVAVVLLHVHDRTGELTADTRERDTYGVFCKGAPRRDRRHQQ